MRVGTLSEIRRKARPGMLSAGGPSLDAQIAALFAAGEEGLDWSDIRPATVWQDAAGTVPGVLGQPVFRLDDKSGRGHHALQATAGSRTVLQQDAGGRYYLQCNGTSQGFGCAISGWSGTMLLSAAIRADTTASHLLFSNATSGTLWTGVSQSGSASSYMDGSITNIGQKLYLDGTEVLPTTRGALNTAIGSGVAHVEEIWPLPMSNFTGFNFSQYSALFFPGRFYGAIATVYSNAQTAALVRKYLGLKAGLSL